MYKYYGCLKTDQNNIHIFLYGFLLPTSFRHTQFDSLTCKYFNIHNMCVPVFDVLGWLKIA